MLKDCADAAETVRKDYGVVTMRKECGDAAETLRKDYGSSADIVRTKCGATAVPLRTRRRSALLGHHKNTSLAHVGRVWVRD